MNSYISWRLWRAGNCSPSNRKWLQDKLSHSSDTSGISSCNGNWYKRFSCIINHLSEVKPANKPVGIDSMRFRRRCNCFKWVCEWNACAGNSDMLFSLNSLLGDQNKNRFVNIFYLNLANLKKNSIFGFY